MNLLIATPSLPSPQSRRSHGDIFVVEQASALARAGHRVVLMCVRPRDPENGPSRGGVVVDDVRGLPTIVSEYPVVRGLSYLPLFRAMGRALRAARSLMVHDLIHAHFGLPIGFASVVCARRFGWPVVVTEHNGPVREICGARLSKAAMGFTLRRADGVIAVSGRLKDDIHDTLKVARPIEVISNMYNSQTFFPGPSRGAPESPEILFVSRRGELKKGGDLAIRAFANTCEMTRWPIRMVVAGPGVEEDLAPLAEQLGIRERCEFTGLIPPERIADFMRRCAFLIIPSRYEPFGIVIIEAMACGKPVVATRSGGPEGLVTPENGLLVPPGDVEALTGAITTMLESFHRYDAEAIARKTLETYGDRVVTERLTSFYANLPMSRRRRNIFAEPIY